MEGSDADSHERVDETHLSKGPLADTSEENKVKESDVAIKVDGLGGDE
jgi:hypothetical protein